jgi:hypothetical protein
LGIGVALGAGSIPEELFNVCYRPDCLTIRKLRRVVLEEVVGSQADLLETSAEALKRRDYAEDVDKLREAVVKEYARVLNFEAPMRRDVFELLGGQRGRTFEDLLYMGNDPVADRLHETAMALYMEYVEGSDVEKLGAADFAVYAIIELLQRGRVDKAKAAETIGQITDWVLA